MDETGLSLLAFWRRRLKVDRPGCRFAAEKKIEELRESGVFGPYELVAFYNQMMNGVACPQDFKGSPAMRA
jgi:hypothetical protein